MKLEPLTQEELADREEDRRMGYAGYDEYEENKNAISRDGDE